MTEQDTFERLQLRYEYDPALGERWYNTDNQLHRTNGPAVVTPDGDLLYYQNGCLHRENDLPAVERDDGTRKWFYHGIPHRLTGPAIIYPDGRKQYFILGHAFSYFEFSVDPRVVAALTDKQD